jgi:hypothetical protein
LERLCERFLYSSFEGLIAQIGLCHVIHTYIKVPLLARIRGGMETE